MIETLLREGFAYHDTQSERFAGELEAAIGEGVGSEYWTRLLHIANHTIGEHLGDWPRARVLAERMLQGCKADAGTSPAWARLAVARFLAGDAVAAMRAEVECLAAADDVRGAYVDAKAALAIAMLGSGRFDEGAGLYQEVMGLADAEAPSPADRGLAVASNNLASDLLEKRDRSTREDALMDSAAEAALVFWRKAGTWVNEARAFYLKALVANALGDALAGLANAEIGLGIIAKNGDEPVDAVFLQLARANALRLADDTEGYQVSLANADSGAASWDNDGLRAWYAEERAKVTRA